MSADFTGFMKNSLVLVDTSSIMLVSTNDSDSDLFWANLVSNAKTSNATIIVPSGVIKELDKHQSSGRKGDRAIEASKRALKKLLSLQKARDIFVVDDHMNTKKEDGSVFADPYFINFVNTYKMSKNLYIITQDVNMMMDIHRTIKFDSLSGKIKDVNGEEVQLIKQKKVTVLKVLRKGVGDEAVIEAGALRKFFPDWTVADIAQEIGRPVDECVAKLKELTGKDILATETISKNYERRLKEAYGLLPPREDRTAERARIDSSSKRKTADMADEQPEEAEQKQVKSKLPEFKPIWE